MSYKLTRPKESTTCIGEYDEIKDFLDVNTQEDIIEFIFNLKNELIRTQEALEVARELILKNSVSKERYNNIVKKYNDLLKKRK